MKRDLLSNVLLFTAGAAIGSVATWFVMKRKYEAVDYEEYYSDETEQEAEEEETEEDDSTSSNSLKDGYSSPKREDMVQYNKIVKGAGYSGDEKEKEKNEEVDDVEKPYLITVDEYSEIEEYETITLYYYADGVVTDQYDNPIDDVDEVVGLANLKEFKRNPHCDSIYIRNDVLRSDYEILRDQDNYYDSHGRED